MSIGELIRSLFPTASATTILLAAVLLYLFRHPEKFDQWGALLFRVLSFGFGRIRAFRARLDRGRIGWEIQAAVNSTGQDITAEAPGVLPYALRVEWVKAADKETFTRRGEVVVRLDQYGNQEKNLVAAAQAYARKALLPKAKQYMDPTLREASIISVVRRVLAASPQHGSYEFFHGSHVAPAITGDNQLRSDCTLLDALDGVGFLTRVFFYEVRELGDQLFPTIPSERDGKEIRAFAEFLGVIAGKEPDVDVPLVFEGPRVRTAVLLIARAGKLRAEGVGPYVRRLGVQVRAGCDPVFVCGWGHDYVAAIRDVVKEAKAGGMIESARIQEFPLSRNKELIARGIIAVCRASFAYRRREKEIIDPVRSAVSKNVPEIRSGGVEIASIARIPGFGSKVAVRLADDDEHPERAVGICIGRDALRLRRIREDLPRGEWLRVVSWHPDISRFIANSLGCDRDDIVEVQLDEENQIGYVTLTSFEARGRALGREGMDIRLSSQLVGWEIQISLGDAD